MFIYSYPAERGGGKDRRAAGEQKPGTKMANPNDDWEGAGAMNKSLKALATSVRPISASRVKTAAATAIQNVKV